MQESNLTARQMWAALQAGPQRKRFGFGRRPALVNVDLQRAYTEPATFPATAYETDPRQAEHVNALASLCRARGLPVVWTHVAYLPRWFRLWRLGHAQRHARTACRTSRMARRAPSLIRGSRSRPPTS